VDLVQRNYKKLAAVLVLVLVALALCAPVASAVGSDRDADGIRNASDNCAKQYNPDQKDLDGDGIGDVCDSDRDGDGQLNADDPCPDDALNGCVAPPPPPPPPPPPGDPVFVGAGDIASCASSGDEATAKLLDGIPGTVYTLGDNAYDSGTSAEFRDCYDPSWGRHKARTRPSVGNHEYQTAGASGYFRYFEDAASPTEPGCRVNCKGYYSYDLGAWHIIALNSMCENVGGCGASSPMVTWLKGDLSANPSSCTLAYWHHPVFSSGSEHGNNPKMIPSWDALNAAGADVVLSGHDHDYERFAPQTSSGVADPVGGIREFVVGTGGRSLRAFGTIRANSEVRNFDSYGVLKLTLHSSGYDWQFVPEAGKTFSDSGSGNCH
jgi:acid phosphatase type 7